MTDAAATEPLDRPRVLLAGDVAARPDGLERALTRAGFRVSEDASRESLARADAVVLTTMVADPGGLAALLPACNEAPPRIVLFATADPELPGTALGLGADDALAAPVHLAELCARIHARIRDRQGPRGSPYERQVREAVEGLLAEARTVLQADEIVLALVRRLARAFDLVGCAFVSAEAAAAEGRVIAEVGARPGERERLDLRRYPEIVEALRTRRTVALPPEAVFVAPDRGPAVALPVVTRGVASGVLLLRRRQDAPALSPAQLELAASMAAAAAQALDGARPSAESIPLERRLHEEYERARRYHLSFSLILLAVEALDGSGDRIAGELRRLLRLPDFVTRYSESEFAVVLPETDAEGARRSIGRMRDRLALPGRALSAGIVSYPHPAVTQPDDLFALVEAALARGRVTDVRIGIAD